jgi:hypothetical protein
VQKGDKDTVFALGKPWGGASFDYHHYTGWLIECSQWRYKQGQGKPNHWQEPNTSLDVGWDHVCDKELLVTIRNGRSSEYLMIDEGAVRCRAVADDSSKHLWLLEPLHAMPSALDIATAVGSAVLLLMPAGRLLMR